MDADRFDSLVGTLAGAGTRRRLLTLLTALPFAGCLAMVLDEEGAAKRKGHNRRAHNHRHSGRRKENRTGERKGIGPADDDRRIEGCADVLEPAGCVGIGRAPLQTWTCPDHVNLAGADLHLCYLFGASLVRANLDGANLRLAGLRRANLSGAVITGNLNGALMTGAIMTGTYFAPLLTEFGANLEGLGRVCKITTRGGCRRW